jgi:hypothetical protein
MSDNKDQERLSEVFLLELLVAVLLLPAFFLVNLLHEFNVDQFSSSSLGKLKDKHGDKQKISLEPSYTDVSRINELQDIHIVSVLSSLIV